MTHCFNVVPEKLDRFQAGPLGAHMQAYAGLLHQRGYTCEAGWGKLRQLRELSRWLERKKISVELLNEQTVGCYLATMAKTGAKPNGERATFNLMLQHLRQTRIIPVARSTVKLSPAEVAIQDYRQYLLSERSLGLATVDGYTAIIRRFLSGRFPGGKFEPQQLKATDIIRFVQQATTLMGRRACQHTTTALRSLLRFLLMNGQLNTNLANAVPKVASWRLSELPRYLEPAEVEKILNGCDRRTGVGKRNYAILLLLARLGLRAGEVVKLKLNDINWCAGELCIQGKGSRVDRLPLLQDVGAAIADYLQRGRPRCSSRCVFVYAQAPYGEFASPPNGISCLVRRALKRAKLNPPHKGAHILRHSLATRMLGNGASLLQIGQPLYVTNVVNGNPVVRFNGINNDFDLGYFMNGTTAAEAFVVLKTATNTQQVLWRWGATGAFVGYPNSSGQIVDCFGSSTTHTIGAPTQLLNQYHVYEVASQNGSWMAWINGLLQDSESVNTYSYWSYNPSLPPMSLGHDQYLGGNYFAGDVAEVLVFCRTLATGERTAVNAYLDGKYGLAVAVPAMPTNLVATAISATQVGLSWNEASTNGVTAQISVERSTTSNGTYSVVAQISGSASYVDTNLTAGTAYYYRVRAIDLAQWSGYSGVAQATTYAGRAAMPFGNLLVWLAADSGLAQTGTNAPVGFWPDQSGSGNNGTQTSSGNQPAWVTGALNGHPVVRFNGTSSYLNLGYFLHGTTQAEAFVVLKVATNPPSARQVLWRPGADGSALAYPNTSGQIVEDFGSGGQAYNIGAPTQPLDQYHVYEVAGQNGSWMAWINGLLQASNNSNSYGEWDTGNPVNEPIGLGWDQYNAQYCFAGDVAEVLVFNRTLTTGERTTVNTYLNGKYELAPAVPATPSNLVAMAGVGSVVNMPSPLVIRIGIWGIWVAAQTAHPPTYLSGNAKANAIAIPAGTSKIILNASIAGRIGLAVP